MKKIFIFLLFIVILGNNNSLSQEVVVPPDVQYSLFTKILSFDRNLKQRVGKEIVLGIIYEENFRSSLLFKDKFIDAMDMANTNTIENIQVRTVEIDLVNEDDLEHAIKEDSINILFLAPIRAIDIQILSAFCRTNHISSFTSVPEYVERGIAVGLGIKGEKPQIIINLPNAKAEGADFNSQLLKLAKIIH